MRHPLSKDRLPILITGSVLGLLLLFSSLRYDNFFSLRVFANLVSDNAFLGVVALGLTFVILTGGIDLSVGSLVGFSGILAAKLLETNTFPTLAAFLIPLGIGTVLGAGQGALISRYGLPPFLVTLAGLFLYRGLALSISRESIQIGNETVRTLAERTVPLPGGASFGMSAIIFVVLIVFLAFLARHTRFGRTVYAVGGNLDSARMMGLPVAQTLISTYALSGFCGALGGLLFILYTSSGNAVGGTGLELDAIAAVVIGGTMLSGGYGSISGTVLGILTLGVVQTALVFEGTLSSWWTRIVIGGLLLVFMLVQKSIEVAAKRRTASI